MYKVGRNDPCPCGSGKKYKRCCLASPGVDLAPKEFTASDRALALEELQRFTEIELTREHGEAFEEFYAEWRNRKVEIGKLEPDWTDLSNSVFCMWFWLDYELPAGGRVADLFLQRNWQLSAAVRSYVEVLCKSVMCLYEIDDLSPGLSLTLRDVLTGSRVTVKEQLGSRQLHKCALIAVRVIDYGPSGRLPEMESGMLPFADRMKDEVVSRFSDWHQGYRLQHSDSDEREVFKQTTPFFHNIWLSSILDPPVLHLKNMDGTDLLMTRVQFDVIEETGLAAALDAAPELERLSGETVWRWSQPNTPGKPIMYGEIVLNGEILELNCISAQHGECGRAMLERLAPDMVRYRSTVQEDLGKKMRDEVSALRQHEACISVSSWEEIPLDEQEAFILDHMARHYRQWIHEPVPALDDHTPRDAARDPTLRPKLIGLIHELEAAYHRALKSGVPAYDPSWMWVELNLDDDSTPMHPPPLAHERIATLMPGMNELCHRVAEQARRRPDFKDLSTILDADEIRANPEIQRFFRHKGCASPESVAADSAGEVARPMSAPARVLINFEMHRRKIFWVDESLVFMLAKTDLDVTGAEVRAPFPSFALVFTDRHTLSLAERMLSREKASPLAGCLLKVATVYIMEERREDRRVISLAFALDALGADSPQFSIHEIPLVDDRPIRHALDELAPRPQTGTLGSLTPEPKPLRALLHITINAILYATSAGVAPEFRRSAELRDSKREPFHSAAPAFSSEDVYFLPGHIEISQVRRLQALERVGTGRQLLHRFMVRGHWRRAAPGWTDQRIRWINPYWKGPDMAAVVERAYRMKP